MSFLQSLFFESPLWLGIFSFLLFAVVLFARRRWEGAAASYALPATLAMIALLFVVQRWVTTEREKIYQTLEGLARTVEQRDLPAIQGYFSAAYDEGGEDRDTVVGSITSILERLAVRDSILSFGDTVIMSDRAELSLGARATVSIRGAVGEFHSGRWRIVLAHEDGDWRITSLRPEMIDGIQVRSMRALRGLTP